MAQLGAVYLDAVYSDQPKRAVKTTDHPLETGEAVTDHVQLDPLTIGITGIIVGSDASVRMKRLEEYQKKGTLLTYVNRISAVGVIILNFDSTHGKDVGNGFTFSMTLKRMKVSQATPIKEMSLPVRTQVKEVTNKGVQQTQTAAQIKAANKKKEEKASAAVVKSTVKGKTPAQAAAAGGNRIK